jgi:hypothetical protein
MYMAVLYMKNENAMYISWNNIREEIIISFKTKQNNNNFDAKSDCTYFLFCRSEDLKLEEGKPFAAVKKTKDHYNNNSCGTTRTMTMTPLRSYWEEKTNWVGGILSVIDDMRWSKHMCMPKGTYI